MTAASVSGDRPLRIDGLRRAVADLRQSIDFYCGALGFERSLAGTPLAENTARLQLGRQHIDLLTPDDPARVQAKANAPDPRFQHAAIVTDDMEAACRRLEAHAAVPISRGGPQRLPANTGGVIAFKFRDPDGHPLELIEFPAGVGDPRWQAGHAGGPTLGIDHFALVIAAIDSSTSFFAARLGLRVAGRGVNRGVEQDRLDGLEGVEVDVVSLEPRQGPRTPHLELLCYRHPSFATHVDKLGVALGRYSDEIVCLGDRCLRAGFGALRLRDPDGHRFIVDI